MPKITLTNKQVLEAIPSLEAVQQARASGAFKLRCSRNLAVLRADADRIKETLGSLQKDAIELDEKGDPRPQIVAGREIPGTVRYKDFKGFEKAQKDLLTATHAFELETYTNAEIDSLEFEGSTDGLLPLITQ